ncbi:MAG: hypothetical protein ACTHK0_13590 [Ginsengibacter sp.]
MRLSFLVITLFFYVAAKSQTILSSRMGITQQNEAPLNSHPLHDSLSSSKWFFTSYRGLSTSISFFKGGNASVFSAPMGLQLNRRLNNNLYAFANVSISPSYVSMNSSYLTSLNKNFTNSPFNQNNFGLYPAASLGLMYINDAKTFSISGSISAEKSMYPVVPYFPVNHTTHSPVFLNGR